jgi:NAD(P)-dependent dehydrogenase (short-subunit alcohol dehydrogenase family)
VLVNNAGTAPLCPLEQIDDKLLSDTLAVNVQAVVYTCRAAWPALQQSRGTIINISSVAAVDPFPGFSLYGATKAWVNAFTQALAGEGKPLGIRALCVGPGAVETRMFSAEQVARVRFIIIIMVFFFFFFNNNNTSYNVT